MEPEKISPEKQNYLAKQSEVRFCIETAMNVVYRAISRNPDVAIDKRLMEAYEQLDLALSAMQRGEYVDASYKGDSQS